MVFTAAAPVSAFLSPEREKEQLAPVPADNLCKGQVMHIPESLPDDRTRGYIPFNRDTDNPTAVILVHVHRAHRKF
jgi:hypothetical protein